MTEERKTKKDTSTSALGHVFIDQNPQAAQAGNSRLVSSQARRFQSAGKRRQQRISAREDAGYARSLVGWGSASSTPSIEGQARSLSPAPPIQQQEPEQGQGHALEQVQRPESEGRLGQRDQDDAQISLAVQTGLRVDPFHAFPSSNSKTVMFMVDYHIHVWSPHKGTRVDATLGYNAQIDLCWPLALQDDMLFDATLAVSRVAFILSLGHSPAEDSLMLYHRGLAMTRLRQRVVNAQGSRETVIFTIARMISLAYMSGEPEAFVAHFLAFRNIAERYINEHPNTDMSQVIGNRLDSWKALSWYRTGYDHLRKRTAAELRVSRRSQSRDLLPSNPRQRSLSPALFPELNLPVEMTRSLNTLDTLIRQIHASPGRAARVAHTSSIAECCRQFGQILTSQDLTPAQSQFGCGLLVFCLQLGDFLAGGGDGEAQSGRRDRPVSDDTALPRLSNIAMTFLNKKLDGFHDSAQHRVCVAWSALVMGSFLAQQKGDNGLRTKGHLIHLTLSLNLGLGLSGSIVRVDGGVEPAVGDGWSVVEAQLRHEMGGSLWHPGLAEQWRRDWQSAMRRQRVWHQQGLWKIGAPKKMPSQDDNGGGAGGAGRSPKGKGRNIAAAEGWDDIDIMEYLVLREARDSLPAIE